VRRAVRSGDTEGILIEDAGNFAVERIHYTLSNVGPYCSLLVRLVGGLADRDKGHTVADRSVSEYRDNGCSLRLESARGSLLHAPQCFIALSLLRSWLFPVPYFSLGGRRGHKRPRARVRRGSETKCSAQSEVFSLYSSVLTGKTETSSQQTPCTAKLLGKTGLTELPSGSRTIRTAIKSADAHLG